MFTRRSVELLSGLLLATGCTIPSTPSPTDGSQDELDASPVEAPRGSDGDKGSDGEDGATGAAGAEGETGPEGPRGAQGEQGETGPAGATGARGPTGATGPTGAAGPQGPVGLQGLQGPQGDPGLPGLAGAVGAPATTDGTRLKAIYYTSADGLKAPHGTFWDVERQTKCGAAVDRVGNYRCLPVGGYRVFTDSSCTVEALMPYAWGGPGGDLGRLSRTDGVGVTVYINVTLGDQATELTFYNKSGANCYEVTTLEQLMSSGYGAPRYVTGEVPDSDFALLTFTRD